MTKDEALKLALEALEVATTPLAKDRQEILRARVAIREALAQPETVSPGGGLVPAVPVAVYGYCPVCGGAGVMRERRPNGDDKCTNGHKYPSSKALAQPEQEPVAWMWRDGTVTSDSDRADGTWTPLYTTPPQRKPLTDEEIGRVAGDSLDAWSCARAIEAAHGIKGSE